MVAMEVDHLLRDVPIGEPEAEEVADLRAQISRLEDDKQSLLAIIEQMQQQMALAQPQPIDQSYSLDQFMVALARKRGRTYGWRTDYAQATRDTPGSFQVSTDDIQKWQKRRRVPEQAYAQIEWLIYRDRIGCSKPNWSSDDIEYLVREYEVDPRQANATLARKCTDHFGRLITEQAIKGEIYRLGEAGRLPRKRPAHD